MRSSFALPPSLRVPRLALSLVVALAFACHPASETEPPESTLHPPKAVVDAPTTPALEADVARLRADLEFLADDAQLGRPPGTEADARVQAYLETQMKDAGLEPAFADGYRQPFSVTDGVRATADSKLSVKGTAIAHAIVPFTTSTSAPVSAPLVFVGHGIATQGEGTGDYEGLGKKVKGAIVVALGGAPKDDPHLPPSVTRVQSKVIAARDHGAVGFILWEPQQTTAYPNHGRANDLKIPVVWVGAAGTPELLEALRIEAKKEQDTMDVVAAVDPGRRGKGKAQLHTPVEPITLDTANVSGVLPGAEAGPVVVIGAHMDHLGNGTASSLAPGVQAVHNGADDNASGVAVVLEVARVLAAQPVHQRPYTLHFVAFGAEEMGLLGSKHYVEHLDPKLRERIVAMINFDMVGRLGAEQGLVVSGTGTSSVWPALLERSRGALEVRASEDGYGASDQTSFYEAGMPVLHFFTGTHADYHKPSDDIDKINFEGAASVAEIAMRVVTTLGREGIEPDFIRVARKAPTRGGFRVSLGTIPDYGANVDGVALTGVREGGAAAQAGLRKGDVIQKIGDREVHNLDDYMATFAVLEPGEAVDVVVLRDGETVTLSLTPQAPQRR